jgi:hypothetical protein
LDDMSKGIYGITAYGRRRRLIRQPCTTQHIWAWPKILRYPRGIMQEHRHWLCPCRLDGSEHIPCDIGWSSGVVSFTAFRRRSQLLSMAIALLVSSNVAYCRRDLLSGSKFGSDHRTVPPKDCFIGFGSEKLLVRWQPYLTGHDYNRTDIPLDFAIATPSAEGSFHGQRMLYCKGPSTTEAGHGNNWWQGLLLFTAIL